MTSILFSQLLLVFYWLPLAVCLPIQVSKVRRLYRADVDRRANALVKSPYYSPYSSNGIYFPDLTVGFALWILLKAFIPIVNFGMAVSVLCGWIFSQPLVPKYSDERIVQERANAKKDRIK